MRTPLFIAVLILQCLSVRAADRCDDPRMRLLTAITRYCVITAASQRENGTSCEYDCLITTETVPKPLDGLCPVTVKQRLYDNGTTEIVLSPQIPLFTDRAKATSP
jgi:hypothetical protein